MTQNAVSGVEADPGACGCVKPGEVSWRWGHCGDCGHVTPGKGSDVGCERGDYGHITPDAWGKGITLETVGV